MTLTRSAVAGKHYSINFDGGIMKTNTWAPLGTGLRKSLLRARFAVAFALPAFALTGCYVIPVDRHGNPVVAVASPAPAPVIHVPAAVASVPVLYGGAPLPATLAVRLYPQNELATRTGVMAGTVSNMMSGRGRFQFDYQGELLSGEATRVIDDERRGVANAYGSRGTFVSCEYQMLSPPQGAGTCTFNNGAKYQVHIGG
jgi:hypothetical protein